MPYASRTKRNRALRQRRVEAKENRQALVATIYTRLTDARDRWIANEPMENLPEPNEVLPTLASALAEHLRETVVQMREDGQAVPKRLLPLLEAGTFLEVSASPIPSPG